MIKTTIGESKTQDVKPFPKLMVTNKRADESAPWIGLFVADGHCMWLTGTYPNRYTTDVNMEGLSDFNEPITIQNS